MGFSKQRKFRQKHRQAPYAKQGQEQPHQRYDNEYQKGFFGFYFFLITHRAEDEFDGQHPIYEHAHNKSARRCYPQRHYF